MHASMIEKEINTDTINDCNDCNGDAFVSVNTHAEDAEPACNNEENDDVLVMKTRTDSGWCR